MAGDTPTIYAWGGGREAFARWLDRFYDLVEGEPDIVGCSAAVCRRPTASTSPTGGAR